MALMDCVELMTTPNPAYLLQDCLEVMDEAHGAERRCERCDLLDPSTEHVSLGFLRREGIEKRNLITLGVGGHETFAELPHHVLESPDHAPCEVSIPGFLETFRDPAIPSQRSHTHRRQNRRRYRCEKKKGTARGGEGKEEGRERRKGGRWTDLEKRCPSHRMIM